MIQNEELIKQIQEWQKDFDSSVGRPLKQRWELSMIYTYKPVLDDAPWRSFHTMKEYREWCQDNLPSWLGYGQIL